MTPVIWSARGVREEVTLTIELVDYGRDLKSRPYELINNCGHPAARKLRVNHEKSWSFNLRLNLKIANFRVRLHDANDLIIDD